MKEELGYELKIEPNLLYAWSYVSRSKNTHGVYVVYIINLKKEIKFSSLEDPFLEFIWLDKSEIKIQNFCRRWKNFYLWRLNHKIKIWI